MSRTCDAIGCKTPNATGMFMCRNHWRMVPQDLQRVINARYRVGKDGLAFLSDLLYLEAAANAIDAVAASEKRDAPHLANSYRRLYLAAQRRAKAAAGGA